MDVLSEVLRVVRLTGAVYFEVTAACPWVSKSPPTSLIKAAVMPEAEHVIPFHIVTLGRAWRCPEIARCRRAPSIRAMSSCSRSAKVTS
mgnify:CR=1 FL=1